MKEGSVYFVVALLLIGPAQGQGVSVCESVTDVVRRREDLSFFNAFIQDIDEPLQRILERPAGRVAIFIPNDDAWNKIPESHLSKIISNSTTLNQLVNQHVLEQVPNLNSLNTINGNFLTLLEDSPVQINRLSPEVNGSVRVLQSQSNEAAVVEEVIGLCLNRGVVFIVDKVLLPFQFDVKKPSQISQDSSPKPDPKFINPLFSIISDPKFFNSKFEIGEIAEAVDPVFINPKFRDL